MSRMWCGALMVVGLLFVSGCGEKPAENAAAVKVTGTVNVAGGKKVNDLKVTFFPRTSKQAQGFANIKDGAFSIELVPGEYGYAFEAAPGKADALKVIPEKYHSNSADITIKIESAGGSITLNAE